MNTNALLKQIRDEMILNEILKALTTAPGGGQMYVLVVGCLRECLVFVKIFSLVPTATMCGQERRGIYIDEN